MIPILFRVTGAIICAVEICLWVIYCDSGVSLILRCTGVLLGWEETYREFSYLAYMQSVSQIYRNLLSELQNFHVRMTCYVVFHSKNGIAKYSYGVSTVTMI